MLITMGGKHPGTWDTKAKMVCRANASTWHIGVPPFAFGSNQTGNFTVCSISPPAPSSTFLVRVSSRSGQVPIRLTGTSPWPSRAPPKAGPT